MSEYIYDWTPNKQHAKEGIVRCRDCKHFEYCQFNRHSENKPNGFCKWGEKASNFTACKCGEDIETNGCEWVVCPRCGRVITE